MEGVNDVMTKGVVEGAHEGEDIGLTGLCLG